MWTIAIVSLLTLAGLMAIFIATILVLYKHPPAINVTLAVPDKFLLIQQKLPASIETDKPTEAPIPADILLYISQESDTWAQEGRKKRARALYTDCHSWPVVLQLMRQEDGELERA